MKKVCIIAAEKSGDLLGSLIIKRLKEEYGDRVSLFGLGGQAMEAVGFKSLFPISEVSCMGLFEVLPKVFKILKRIKEIAKLIIYEKPDLVLTIDAPDFCFRVIKKVKKLKADIKTAHLVAPSVWAYREGRAAKIAKFYDLLLCLLPFEPRFFEKYGLRSVFVGHPIFDETKDKDFNYYKPDSNVISITPGSRLAEIKALLPLACGVIRVIRKKHPGFRYNFFCTEDTIGPIQKYLVSKNFDLSDVRLISETISKEQGIKESRLVLAKSGTNTLEIAKFGIPMVIFYKFNIFTNTLIRIFRRCFKIRFANLINIINDKEIIPEFILENCTLDKISKEVDYLLEHQDDLSRQLQVTGDTIKLLGFGSSLSSTDKIIEELKKICGE